MDRLRTPFFLVALGLFLLVVLIEVGSTAVLGTVQVTDQALVSQLSGELRDEYEEFDDDQRAELRQLREQVGPPGLGIPMLALIDGCLLYTLLLVGSGLVVPERLLGRVQGLLTLVLSFILICGSIALAFSTLTQLLLMVGLLLAVPFGAHICVVTKAGRFAAVRVVTAAGPSPASMKLAFTTYVSQRMIVAPDLIPNVLPNVLPLFKP